MKIWYWIIRIIRWLMSIFNCHKQEPQPWMSYISSSKICFSGGCCPVLVTDVYSLLPFQIISEGDYIRSEISVYGSGVWTEITVPVTSVITDGFYIHTYNGETLSEELTCGAYEFRVIAGEPWWFEPFTVEEFEFYENAYHKRDLLMLPFKFSDLQFETIPLIAPCDSFLPFMFTTENETSGSPQYYLYDVVNDCEVVELTDIVVTVLTIDGRTYYIHEGDCIYPFLECGIYKIEIVDGDHSYFSVPFDVECGLSDIPDGSRVMRDANGCVMRDELGGIIFESCIDGLDIIDITVGDTAANLVIIYFNVDIDTFSVPNLSDFIISFSGGSVTITTIIIPVDGEGNSTTIEITLNRAITSTELGIITYLQNTPPIISLTEGKPIGSFYDRDIINNV